MHSVDETDSGAAVTIRLTVKSFPNLLLIFICDLIWKRLIVYQYYTKKINLQNHTYSTALLI